jgi:Cupin-like domain
MLRFGNGYTNRNHYVDNDDVSSMHEQSFCEDGNEKTNSSKNRLRIHRRVNRIASRTSKIYKCNIPVSIVFLVILIFLVVYYAWHESDPDSRNNQLRLRRTIQLWALQHRQQEKDTIGEERRSGAKREQNLNLLLNSIEVYNDALESKLDNETDTNSLQHQFEYYRAKIMKQKRQRTTRTEQGMELLNLSERLRFVLNLWLENVNSDIRNNINGGIRWIRPYLLPTASDFPERINQKQQQRQHRLDLQFFRVDRENEENHLKMKWEEEYEELEKQGKLAAGPLLDYTNKSKYEYPPKFFSPPIDGSYPTLKSLKQIFAEFPQDTDYDVQKFPIQETLIHFDYSNQDERSAAALFREAELPFKLVNIPEIDVASTKWTDEYVGQRFENSDGDNEPTDVKLAKGSAQESINNFFAFFVPPMWNVETMGLPPVRNNDWTFTKWSKHAKYADAISLEAEKPHFYWQAGVDRTERYEPMSKWTFISKDLPSFSSTVENFFLFHPESQKGIQCRFGERGVVAATHYDAGRNMIAMVTGAKRYILSPPNQCSKLGIFKERTSPIARHSLLNFGHIRYLDDESGKGNGSKISDMSEEEKAWLELAASSHAVETVLKKGEGEYLICEFLIVDVPLSQVFVLFCFRCLIT